jgi:CCR4-NOT complex subunit CAF16
MNGHAHGAAAATIAQAVAEAAAIELDDLWFSYEVAENISATAPQIERKILRDGGLSVDAPRAQHDQGTRIVRKLELSAISMALPAGARCLLVGANGAGKSTLLNVVGGKHMVEQNAARVLGRPAFHDTTLCAEVALLTGNWTHTVNFVGHNVPYQAMEVTRLVDGLAGGVDRARLDHLIKLLEVDLSWNLTTVSDGQRRRVQILCKLARPCSVLPQRLEPAARPARVHLSTVGSSAPSTVAAGAAARRDHDRPRPAREAGAAPAPRRLAASTLRWPPLA